MPESFEKMGWEEPFYVEAGDLIKHLHAGCVFPNAFV